MIEAPTHRICFVNCGLPGDQCACFRSQMANIFADLAKRQEPLGAEFDRVWFENLDQLYQA